MTAFDLPAAVKKRALSFGIPGEVWLAGLPDLVARRAQLWAFEPGETLAGGSEALVLEATLAGDTQAVLKVGLPGSADSRTEALVYRAAGGQGYARLFEHDEADQALLLERLGRPLSESSPDKAVQRAALCATLREAWSAPLDDVAGAVMSGAEKTAWLVNFIKSTWAAHGEPCSLRVVERAIDFAEQRAAAHASAPHVLVHGDAHSLNALEVPGSPGTYRFVDPDALVAERACDLAVPMREDNAELLAGDPVRDAIMRCEQLAELGDSTPTAVWQWGFVERVSTGLAHFTIDMAEEGKPYLEVAQHLAGVTRF